MVRNVLLIVISLFYMQVRAGTIPVKNLAELDAANKKAKPGDIIILQNGEWKNVIIRLTCNGTKEMPVTFKAQTAGKVLITGNSQLKLGGNYIVVDGLFFTEGSSGREPVISFRLDSKQLANNCRVTNSAIIDFNNARRMDENNWVLFYGKNNRLDHCSFRDKNNMGVLLAVILDDDRSRENFHQIDHNYFGRRIPLGSNGGEIIRVGVSQHCQYNSNTQITDNYFEECDGEAEVISIKSGTNLVRGNVFKECQGSVVLRHGDFNTVENNIFLGNNKPGTGGIRVVNKGQWVVNNFLYECRGIDFRSPLTVMNGIPNSPANRYVQVTDAVIANNTFVNCSPASFCDGSDAERSLPPDNVLFINNLFYNNRDSIIYRTFDNISGFTFAGNEISRDLRQNPVAGFRKISFAQMKTAALPVFTEDTRPGKPGDSVQQVAQLRLNHQLSHKTGFSDAALFKKISVNATTTTGVKWYKPVPVKASKVVVNCRTPQEIHQQLEKKEAVIINLIGVSYLIDRPFVISKKVQFTGNKEIRINMTSKPMQSVFLIRGNGELILNDLYIDGRDVKANHFISNDSSGSTGHYNFSMVNCTIRGLRTVNGCTDILFTYKSNFADSIVFRGNTFIDNDVRHFVMNSEKEDKGLYAAEKVILHNNTFIDEQGIILDLYRGGSDESTLGPSLTFTGNKFTNCRVSGNEPLIRLTGVQYSTINQNEFINCLPAGTLLLYTDKVRAYHRLEKNKFANSGKVETNPFVAQKENTVN